jgi:hypothetical protein
MRNKLQFDIFQRYCRQISSRILMRYLCGEKISDRESLAHILLFKLLRENYIVIQLFVFSYYREWYVLH